MGGCQNYGPFLGPYYNTGPNTGPNLGDPKRDHNFDNPPCVVVCVSATYRPRSSEEDNMPKGKMGRSLLIFHYPNNTPIYTL